jgi:hypothetical protein
MKQQDLLYINYWKKEVTNDELQQWIDKLSIYSKKYWLILIEEKLIRAEEEY